jgi:mRNA interferase YafQ
MFDLEFTGQFKKDYKLIVKRNYDIEKIHQAFRILENSGTLPTGDYNTHLLKGDYSKHLEAHIEPDWLIIWQKQKNKVKLVRTGTHSDLFK